MHLRRTQSNHGVDWEQLVVTHAAAPEFVFELMDETVRLRLLAKSERDGSHWIWNGHEWVTQEKKGGNHDKPEILDDARLEPATQWLRKIDWFTPEPGLWVGDANEAFLSRSHAFGRNVPANRILGKSGFSPAIFGTTPTQATADCERQRH